MEIANDLVIQLIRKFSLTPDKVYVSERAEWEMWSFELTKYDICDALVRWIDKGETVEKDITNKDPKHVGEPIYIFSPIRINQKDYYVKVSFPNNNQNICMHIVSAHN